MKNLLLLIIISCATMQAKAQNFDEIDLLGKWTPITFTGQLPGLLKSFGTIELGDASYIIWTEDSERQASGKITDMVIKDPNSGMDETDNEYVRDFLLVIIINFTLGLAMILHYISLSRN